MSTLKPRTPLAQIGKKDPKCRVCKKSFKRRRVGEIVCSVECSIEKTRTAQVAKACAPYRAKPSKPRKDRSHQLELTQKAFNAWIRWRDRDLPCISSGATTAAQWDAGHYVAVGSAKGGSLLRFDENNVHKQTCEQNQFKGGAPKEYRVNLIKLIGIDEVLRLENTQGTKKWDIDELKAIRAEYRKRLRDEMREAGM